MYRGTKPKFGKNEWRIDRGKPKITEDGLSVSENCKPTGKPFYLPFVVAYKRPKKAEETVGVIILPTEFFGSPAIFSPTSDDPTHWSLFALDPPNQDGETKQKLTDYARDLNKKGTLPTGCSDNK